MYDDKAHFNGFFLFQYIGSTLYEMDHIYIN